MKVLSESRPPRAPRIVILGGGYAGMAAARELARERAHADIRLIDRDDAFVERIRLHQRATGQALAQWSRRSQLEREGVTFEQGTVEALDPDARRVTLRDAAGHRTDIGYDALVYALGSRPQRPGWGALPDGFHVLGTANEAESFHRDARTAGRVLVVGAGLTGIEFASELAESRPDVLVTLVAAGTLEPSQTPGGYAAAACRHFHRTFDQLGIEFLPETHLVSAANGRACTAAGGEIPFDRLLWAGGFEAHPLAGASGIETDERGRIRTGPDLRSLSHPDIVAVGDAAEAATADSGPCRMSCATAIPMGTAGARTVAAWLHGEPAPEFRFRYRFRNVSLGRTDGVIQFVDPTDRPLDLVLTGRLAARWKAFICEWTLGVLGSRPMPLPPTDLPAEVEAHLRSVG